MARPPLPIGTWGHIHTKLIRAQTRDRPEVWEAHARFRRADGHTPQVRATGSSRTKAENALKVKLDERRAEAIGGAVAPDTRIKQLAKLWMADRHVAYRTAGKPLGTLRTYDTYLRNWVLPAVGELQARELKPWRCDQVIKRALSERSYSAADSVRTVLLGICSWAVANGAMDTNPARAVGRLEGGTRAPVRALDLEHRLAILSALEELAAEKHRDKRGRRTGQRTWWIWAQLPDIMRGMLSTGVRISELLAISAAEVDPQDQHVKVAWHIVREPETGLHRYALRKSGGRELKLGVPEWSVPMWRERKLASGGGMLWQDWRGNCLDPNNVGNKIRMALSETGYDWVTSHVWRKTVASVLDEADLPTTAIADQLGNSPDVVERHYRRGRQTNQAAREILEGMMGS